MSFLAWVILGAIAGWLGSKIFAGEGRGFLLNVGLGILGAVVGGLVVQFFGMRGASGVNIWSIIVATFGAILVQWIYFKVVGSR